MPINLAFLTDINYPQRCSGPADSGGSCWTVVVLGYEWVPAKSMDERILVVLPHRSQRHRVDEVNRLGCINRRLPLPHQSDQRLSKGRAIGSRVNHQHSRHPLPPLLIGQTDDAALPHERMRVQDVLDLARIDVEAT